jgi:hypothetical protein
MKSESLFESFKKYLEAEKLSEATTSGIARGSYKPPVRPGLTYWDPEDLQPFVDSISNYVDAEINYDSLDGDITTPKKEIKKREKIAKKIQKDDFKQDGPAEGDDEYTKAPFKILIPSYRKKGDKTGKKPRMKKNKFNFSAPFISESETTEDLAVWFGTKKKPKGSKQPKGPWVNICRKKEGGGHPPCGRPEADLKGYPKCRAAGVAAKMTDSQKKSACAQKRRAEKKEPKTGTGNSPTMTSYNTKNESVLINLLLKSLKEQ